MKFAPNYKCDNCGQMWSSSSSTEVPALSNPFNPADPKFHLCVFCARALYEMVTHGLLRELDTASVGWF